MSTVSPAVSEALAARVAELGAATLDAPVSGSVVTLEEGALDHGRGDPEVVACVLPILRDIGPKVTHVGGNGRAVLMKIATNLSLAVQMVVQPRGCWRSRPASPRRPQVEVLLNSVIAPADGASATAGCSS